MRKLVVPVVQAVFRLICDSIGSERSHEAAALFESSSDAESFKRASNGILGDRFAADASVHSKATSFGDDYFVESFLSKWKGLKTGIDTRKVALETWSSFEDHCRQTNERILCFRTDSHTVPTVAGLSVVNLVCEIQRKIEALIGRSPPFKTIARECRWSGGATFSHKRGTSFTKKMTAKLDITRRAQTHMERILLSDPHWFESLTGIHPSGDYCILREQCFREVLGSRVLVVAKNAKTGRTIAAEPTGNAFLQQGVGRYFRSCLLRVGVDLNDQTFNQALSAFAFFARLATLDLKSASDCTATELVYLLFPIEWAVFLDDLRSQYARVDGKWRKLSKFSSMGNAFTFELESLIFWAIIKACQEIGGFGDEQRMAPIGVYGDDLIVPQELAPVVVPVLEYFGFVVNPKKSHTSGAFFESCGKHYFQGTDVTPVYQKEDVIEGDHNFLPELIRLHNRVFRWTMRLHADPSWNKVRIKLLRLVLSYVPAGTGIPRIPWDEQSDDGFLTDPLTLGPYDRNHGVNCLVLTYRTDYGGLYQLAAFAYKLRQFRWQAALIRESRSMRAKETGKWVYRQRWIHTTGTIARFGLSP